MVKKIEKGVSGGHLQVLVKYFDVILKEETTNIAYYLYLKVKGCL